MNFNENAKKYTINSGRYIDLKDIDFNDMLKLLISIK